jgi:hypothetical protein
MAPEVSYLIGLSLLLILISSVNIVSLQREIKPLLHDQFPLRPQELGSPSLPIAMTEYTAMISSLT